MQSGIPAQHRQCLHFACFIGIGNDVHVQVAEVVQVLPDAFPVGGLPEHLPLFAQIEGGGCLYAEAGNGMRLVAQGAGVGHAADKSAYAHMAFAVPAVLRISGEVGHALLCDVKLAVGRAVYRRHFDRGVETEVFQPFVGV